MSQIETSDNQCYGDCERISDVPGQVVRRGYAIASHCGKAFPCVVQVVRAAIARCAQSFPCVRNTCAQNLRTV